LSEPYFYRGVQNERGVRDITWHGTTLDAPGFADAGGRALACTIAGFEGAADLHVMMNMFWEPLNFEVPVDPLRVWRVVIDTAAPSPADIVEVGSLAAVVATTHRVSERSIVVLRSDPHA